MPAAGLHVHLLGTFRLLDGEAPVKGFDQARLQELLAYLLLHRERPVPRQQLAFLFWPDSTEEQARTNLRNLWHRLRRALPGADRFLTTDELTVQWRDACACWLDVAAFEAGVQRAGASADDDEQIAALKAAAAVYGGELLPGCYSDWLLAERERLAQTYGAALEQLAALYEAQRDYPQAIARAQALLRHDPLHELAYTRLMRLHALNDDRAAALHTYHTCATTPRRDLDVEPGHATRVLYQRLLSAQFQPAATAPAPAAPAIPLMSREAEWAQLLKTWRAAVGGPRVVLISGEAGIGKTRLAEELAEWAGRQGITVLSARCYPQGAGGEMAYAPAIAWLRGGPRPRLADPWLRELARLLPEISVERPDLPLPAPLTEGWQRTRLFETLAHALLAGRSAVLLILDDLQWCDRDTLDWLRFLLTARPGQDTATHLLIVATLRSEAREADAALVPWRDELARGGQLSEIELGPLSQEATLALAGQAAGRPLDQALGPLLYRDTEGYPLFVVEMVRVGFAAAGRHPAQHVAAMLAAPAALPERVCWVLDARLAQLSPPARGVIELAAVVGRAFTFDVLAAASDLDEGLLVAALDEAWRRRIIREQGGDAYDFSHEKLRETAYVGLSRARRRWLHGQVGRALERLHAGDLDAAAGALAGHWEAAGQPAQAIAYLDRSARRARRLYAHRDALAALERAIGLLPALPDSMNRCELAAPLQEARGDVLELLAQHAAARDGYTAALACTPQSARIAQARLQRKIGKTLENEQADYDLTAVRYAAAEVLLGAADEGADLAWWEEWCQVQIEHLLLLYWWGRTAEMAQRLAAVQPAIEQHGTPFQRAALFSNLSRRLNRSTRYAPSEAALAYARAAQAALPSSVSQEVLGPYLFQLGFNLLWQGDYAEAQAVLAAALALAEQTGDITLQARCLAYLVVTRRRQGQDAEAETLASRTLAAARAAGMFDYIGAAQGSLAWLAWRSGDLDQAARQGAAALPAWRQHAAPYPFHWQALWPLIGVALARGHVNDAVDHARSLCDPSQQQLPSPIEEPLLAALAAWDAGQPDVARDRLLQAIDIAQQAKLF
jgi:DNA-binding SARP family transcriptional activator